MSDHTIDTARDSDWDDIFRVVRTAFLSEHSAEESAAERAVIEIDRTLVARRAGEVVGTASIQTRRLAVPGGLVPAAHVTGVAVTPTPRRRGILTDLMRRMFADALAAGERPCAGTPGRRPRRCSDHVRLALWWNGAGGGS